MFRVTVHRLDGRNDYLLVVGEQASSSYLAHWTGSAWQGSVQPNPAPLVFPFEKDVAGHHYEHHEELLGKLRESDWGVRAWFRVQG